MHVGDIIAQIGEGEGVAEVSRISEIVRLVGEVVDAAGVALIVLGLIITTGYFLLRLRQGGAATNAYHSYREGLGRTLLLGLEFLVAADIIRTVAVAPTFYNLGILAVIVTIRTFLSWTLQLELEGSWPWQESKAAPSVAQPHQPPKPEHDQAV